jgi:hypothetical protein
MKWPMDVTVPTRQGLQPKFRSLTRRISSGGSSFRWQRRFQTADFDLGMVLPPGARSALPAGAHCGHGGPTSGRRHAEFVL